MLKHIHISQLRPGMYVINPGLDWRSHPYLYMEERYVDAQSVIERIRDEGYLEMYIDLARSDCAPGPAPLVTDGDISSRQEKPSLKPTVPFDEELRVAVKVHDESVAYARRFMKDIQTGKLSMGVAAQTMENIMGSLQRNADALISLSRLHRNDSYTYTHCVNVCILTTLYARYQGKDEGKVFTAGLAGLFHDLGKALVPSKILNAPRKLTRVELEVMRSHPALGHEQLATVPGIQSDVLRGALEHHEKHNGTGYPKGLSGSAISEIGRLVGVSDIYDALTSKRAYKEAMFPHRALGIMYEMRDKDIEHETLARFIRMLGVYPVGSVVELEDGFRGVVCAANPESPAKPQVLLVQDAAGNALSPGRVLDLGLEGAPGVNQCLDPERAGILPAVVLGIAATA